MDEIRGEVKCNDCGVMEQLRERLPNGRHAQREKKRDGDKWVCQRQNDGRQREAKSRQTRRLPKRTSGRFEGDGGIKDSVGGRCGQVGHEVNVMRMMTKMITRVGADVGVEKSIQTHHPYHPTIIAASDPYTASLLQPLTSASRAPQPLPFLHGTPMAKYRMCYCKWPELATIRQTTAEKHSSSHSFQNSDTSFSTRIV